MGKKEKKPKKKMKPLKKLIVIVSIVLASILLILFGARLYFRLPVYGYYRASEKGFKIPGLSDGFVAQGLDYDGQGYFWITGYMNDGSASPVYIVEKETGELVKTLYLANEDGSAYTGHAGGIAVTLDYVYIAGSEDHCVYAFRSQDMVRADDDAAVKAAGSIPTKVSDEDYLQPACLYIENGYLFVLEFYRDVDYPTPDSHKLTTPSGALNQALAVVYELEEDGLFGVDPTPDFAISLPDQVQGMCMEDDRVYLSTSWGTSFSHIYEYRWSEVVKQKSEITFLGTTMPLYYFEVGNLVNDYKIPPMSEEIVMVDGKLYTMCESASNKYIFGKLTSSQWCYATNLWEMN